MDATGLDAEAVVGDECHIIGEKPTAARGEFGIGRDDLDEYDNLILLCKVHHKLVDDQRQTYPVERLRDIKAKHECWVTETLGRKPAEPAKPTAALLCRIQNGKELASLLNGIFGLLLDHDEPENADEAKLIAGFLQNIQDWTDIWGDLDSGAQVEARFSLTEAIKEIEQAGFYVFGIPDEHPMGNNGEKWPVAVITVVRQTNKGITNFGELASIIFASERK